MTGSQVRMLLAYLDLDIKTGAEKIGIHHNTLSKACGEDAISEETINKIKKFSSENNMYFYKSYIILGEKEPQGFMLVAKNAASKAIAKLI